LGSAADALRHLSAGRASHDPAVRRTLHDPGQGHVAGRHHRRVRADARRPGDDRADVQILRDLCDGGGDLLRGVLPAAPSRATRRGAPAPDLASAMPAIALADVSLHYETRGPEQGAPIVLLHGLGSSSSDWALQLPPLAARRRGIAPDLRGHGRSSRPRGRLTVASMSDYVARLLAALGAPPAHVVGLSLGGCVALALALDRPDRVRSLTLVNAFARPAAAGPRGALRTLARVGLLACAP